MLGITFGPISTSSVNILLSNNWIFIHHRFWRSPSIFFWNLNGDFWHLGRFPDHTFFNRRLFNGLENDRLSLVLWFFGASKLIWLWLVGWVWLFWAAVSLLSFLSDCNIEVSSSISHIINTNNIIRANKIMINYFHNNMMFKYHTFTFCFAFRIQSTAE